MHQPYELLLTATPKTPYSAHKTTLSHKPPYLAQKTTLSHKTPY
jgi:hypothetical protein